MDSVEENLWDELVKGFLVTGPEAALPKAQQQALAVALQEWTARCIAARLLNLLVEQERGDLEHHVAKEVWQVHHRGKDFLGAVRWQEVDVWMTNAEAGLVLAVDPKHFQSQDSLKKNWKNGHNDLVALATNLHERFPLCAVGGVISFPSGQPRRKTSNRSIASADAPFRASGHSMPTASSKALGWPYTMTTAA